MHKRRKQLCAGYTVGINYTVPRNLINISVNDKNDCVGSYRYKKLYGQNNNEDGLSCEWILCGSKFCISISGVWQKIISEIPKCSLFIDAMCGSGLIGSLVNDCQVIFNDINEAVIKKIKSANDFCLYTSEDYRKIIQRYDNGNRERVFYFDPPYLFETRSYQLPIYKFEWDATDHKKFLSIITKMKSCVMVSHFTCKLYDTSLKNWRKINYPTMTRAGQRIETLYMNFKQPVLLQCFQHVGKDYIDRQRLKRKISALLSRFDKYDPQERAAVLSSIIDHYNYVTKK